MTTIPPERILVTEESLLEGDARELIEGITVPRKTGPRDLPRVRHGLRPAMTLDRQWPSMEDGQTHRLLSAHGSTWWAFGKDHTLRSSTDEGRNWKRVFKAPTDGQMGRDGMWLKSAAGTLFTTWSPLDNSAPAIWRSADNGVSWQAVIPAVTGVKFLGPTSIVQSPVTGHLYAGEYVTAAATERPTFRIWRSTDDGLTWTAWKECARAQSDPNARWHCHGIQVDPFTNRIWVAIGDAYPASGLYRLTTDEADWQEVASNRMLDTANGVWGGAVGLMFFPNYIAWGVDQSFTSGLIRMARSEIGKPTPATELVMKLNTTGFYTCRTDSTSTEWVMSSSQEGPGQRIDNSIHLYRVADDAATVDEILSFPSHLPTAFHWAYPLGTPLQDDPNGLMFWGTNIYDGQGNTPDLSMTGFQFAGRVGWSNQSAPRPVQPKPIGPALTQHSGRTATVNGPGGYYDIGSTVVPPRMNALYIIETHIKGYTAGGGQGFLEVWRASPFELITLPDSQGPASFNAVSLRYNLQASAERTLHRIPGLTAGQEVLFRIRNSGSPNTYGAFVTYAWGF